MFAYTLGILTIETPSERKKLDEIWLVTEFIKGKTLKEMLNVMNYHLKNFLDIFAQILVALEIGQNKYKFCHYDVAYRQCNHCSHNKQLYLSCSCLRY